MMSDLRPKLYRFALALTKRVDEAEDVVQEVGIIMWKRHEDLCTIRSFEAYAMSSVRNRCLDYIRSPRYRTEEINETFDTSHEQTPYKSLERDDMVSFVKRLIEQLPEQQQSVIRLRDVEGYEFDEIAEILGMSDNAVRTNLSRARQKIREVLLKQ